MKILKLKHNNNVISYIHHISNKNNNLVVIFSHGLMSNMHGKKAIYIENFCKENDISFIRYDNYGSGESSGKLSEQNISSWKEGLEEIILNLTTTNQKIILIGSSKGAWISLLAAQKENKILQNYHIKSLLLLAPATDFTEELLWNNLTEKQQKLFKDKQFMVMDAKDHKNKDCNESYMIAYHLIEDGRKHLLLNKKEINIKNAKVRIIHGMQDFDVPIEFAINTAKKLSSGDVMINLIKDADHRLSREQDLIQIKKSLMELVND